MGMYRVLVQGAISCFAAVYVEAENESDAHAKAEAICEEGGADWQHDGLVSGIEAYDCIEAEAQPAPGEAAP